MPSGRFFMVAALIYLSHVIRVGISDAGYIGVVMGVVFLIVGFKYFTQSMMLTAYDLTYHVAPDGLRLTTEKGREILVEYSDIKAVEAIALKNDMDYVILHIVTNKHKFDCHIEGRGDLAYDMRDTIREYAHLEPVEG